MDDKRVQIALGDGGLPEGDFTMAGRTDGSLWIVKHVDGVKYDIFISWGALDRIVNQVNWNRVVRLEGT